MLKGLEKHKNKMAQGKTYNKLPRRINHKAPKSKANTSHIILTPALPVLALLHNAEHLAKQNAPLAHISGNGKCTCLVQLRSQKGIIFSHFPRKKHHDVFP